LAPFDTVPAFGAGVRFATQVAINYHRDKDAAQETLDGLPGGGHMLVQADVAQPSQAQKLV